MNFLKNSEEYNHWLPIITVMVECGLRAGEATGLRWEDINLDTGEISVNHTLIYYSHREKGCLYGINTPQNGSWKSNCAYDSGSQGCVCAGARVSGENWNFLQGDD